ncbi:MAG TPA: CDGSH iron-sulfur domain-containing protein [Longilinea sp.]|nr:CDGSH iron-sulfur domain-containing protein [Longilinea sp.]
MPPEDEPKNVNKIVVQQDGPYLVQGDIPLVRKIQVVSEYGEPLTWQKEGQIEAECEYCLCRCGHSGEKPFCDGTHCEIGFDGTEDADTHTTAERQMVIPGGTHIVVKRDFALCTGSGFCGTRDTNVDELTPQTDDTQLRSLVMAMIERCPSGSYAYSIEKDGPDIEPDLPQEIAVTTEITSEGPIAGPLWVTGNIPVERADGRPFETRNRVTLCSCGRSHIKPLCDGTHRLKETK